MNGNNHPKKRVKITNGPTNTTKRNKISTEPRTFPEIQKIITNVDTLPVDESAVTNTMENSTIELKTSDLKNETQQITVNTDSLPLSERIGAIMNRNQSEITEILSRMQKNITDGFLEITKELDWIIPVVKATKNQQDRLMVGQVAYAFEYQVLIRLLSEKRRKSLKIHSLFYFKSKCDSDRNHVPNNNSSLLNRSEIRKFETWLTTTEMEWDTISKTLNTLKDSRHVIAHHLFINNSNDGDKNINLFQYLSQLFGDVTDVNDKKFPVECSNEILELKEEEKKNALKILNLLERYSKKTEMPLLYDDLKFKHSDSYIKQYHDKQ